MQNKNSLIGFNKFTITLILIYFLTGVSATYAYYSFNYENDSVIAGNVVSINATLSVERVVGSNDGLVPLMDDALSNAINGIGTPNGACVDSLGNLSCQVYKITLKNNGSSLQHVLGTIKLYPKSGNGNAYSNLKWQELSDATTVKEGSIVNNMNNSILVSDLSLSSRESKTWYIGLWLSETGTDQSEMDKGEFEGTVKFEVDESIEAGTVGVVNNSFAANVMEFKANSDSSVDFSKNSNTSGTNGIYLKKDTEEDTYPVYYYRGNVDNNLIFAGFCWKIVRTTETGGLKIIYNGVPNEGTCNNSGTSSQIGTSRYSEYYDSLAYVGYMYGATYKAFYRNMSSSTAEYVYGNDVSYSNGVYTLVDTVTSGSWSSIYNSDIKNHHYTCFSTSDECTNLYYIYYTSSTLAYYIELVDGKKVEDALSEMLDNNTVSSTIKGNNTTLGSLDYWYYNNIELAGYSSYLEDTVWCNDRSIYDIAGFEPDGGDPTKNLYFGAYGRTKVTNTPSTICPREIDKFTVSVENGNGALDYPVGLLTADEIMLAGGSGVGNNTYYLYIGSNYWLNSPFIFFGSDAGGFRVDSSGVLGDYGIYNMYGVRPVISLKHGFVMNDVGTGTVNNPYVIE